MRVFNGLFLSYDIEEKIMFSHNFKQVYIKFGDEQPNVTYQDFKCTNCNTILMDNGAGSHSLLSHSLVNCDNTININTKLCNEILMEQILK